MKRTACSKRARMCAHIPRNRSQKATTSTSRWACPYEDHRGRCTGLTVNLWRHLFDCHPQLADAERKLLHQKAKEERKKERKMKKEKIEEKSTTEINNNTNSKRRDKLVDIVYRICPSCDTEYQRVDNHIHKFHKVARGTSAFVDMLTKCKISRVVKAQHNDEIKEDVTLDQLLDEFACHLQGLAGTSLTEKRAQATRSQVKFVIDEMLRGKKFEMSDLKLLRTVGDVSGEGGALHRLKEARQLTNGTLFNYALSLEKFISFLRLTHKMPLNEDATLYVEYIQKIIKSLDKNRKPEAITRKTTQREKVLSSDQVKEYFKSAVCKEIWRKLNEPPSDAASFCKIRNHLLLQFHLLNAKRGGDCIHMTKAELENVEKRQGGHNIVTVHEHKNKGIRLCFVNFRHSMLDAANKYLANVRPFAKPSVEYVFTTSDGKKLQESASLIQSAWQDYGTELGVKLPHITATIVRYTASTDARRPGKFSREQHRHLAEYMAHDLRTADSYYDAERGLHIAEIASDMILQSYGILENDLNLGRQ